MVGGILIGGFIAASFLNDIQPMQVNPKLVDELSGYGITDYSTFVPKELFNFPALLTLKGFILIVGGGFLIGFGTRYARGCTSGHSIILSEEEFPKYKL